MCCPSWAVDHDPNLPAIVIAIVSCATSRLVWGSTADRPAEHAGGNYRDRSPDGPTGSGAASAGPSLNNKKPISEQRLGNPTSQQSAPLSHGEGLLLKSVEGERSRSIPVRLELRVSLLKCFRVPSYAVPGSEFRINRDPVDRSKTMSARDQVDRCGVGDCGYRGSKMPTDSQQFATAGVAQHCLGLAGLGSIDSDPPVGHDRKQCSPQGPRRPARG